MDKAKKRLVSALDGLRNLHKNELELDEKITSDQVRLKLIARHGLPDDPRCIAYDPVQRLLAIGAAHGSIRLFGDVGVDYFLKHESDAAVVHIQFLINEGAFVTACRNDMIHLWNFRQKVPEIVHSIQMNKEQITCINIPFQSKWLHVGTERGNIYFINLATFVLSTYVINWNKAIDLSCRTHPGSVRSIATCPTDSSKILILFEKGILLQWNLVTKEVDRFQPERPIRCASWHHDGRQVLCGCTDGSLVVWNMKKSGENVQKLMPHGERCKSVLQIDWRHSSDGEQLIIFSGGMPQDDGALQSLTLLKSVGSATVLELDHPLIEFVSLTPSPSTSVPQQPFAVAVLLKHDLLVVDLNTPGYPCIENVNPMDIHEVPVTCINYFSDCPVDLVGALILVGCKQRRQGYSEKPWPVNGGIGKECASGCQEILLTGHEDGSVNFWQTSGESLQMLYKLKTGRHFERGVSDANDISHAVINLELCIWSRLLLVAGQSGQVTLFHFMKMESAHEISVIYIPSFPHRSIEENSYLSAPSSAEQRRKQFSMESRSTDTSEGSNQGDYFPLKVRGGALRRPAGYQPELVCLIPWRTNSSPETITSLALNSTYGVIAIGTSCGFALVDVVQYCLINSWSTSELFPRSATNILVRNNSDSTSNEASFDNLSTNSPACIKSFMRFNTEVSRSSEKHPALSKTHSVVDSVYGDRELNKDLNARTSSKGDLRETGVRRDSRSSSPSSQDKLPITDAVTSLAFIYGPSKKNDAKVEPTLWLGTSDGICAAFNLSLPSNRLSSNVVATVSGSFIHLKGQILDIAFLDQSFCIIAPAYDAYRDKENDLKKPELNDNSFQNKVMTKASQSPSYSSSSDYMKEDDCCLIVVITSEEQIRVLALPAYNQIFSHRPEIPLIKAVASHLNGSPILLALNAAGQVVVFSLPSLRLLTCTSLFKQSIDLDDSICKKTSLSENGLGMYLATPSELQKFTVSSEFASQVEQCAGELFVPVDFTEPQKPSFFRGVSTLFAGQKESVDLDSIFSEKTSGSGSGYATNSMRSVAKTIVGSPSSMDKATSRSITAGQAATLALQSLNERGEKLSSTVDATERLKDNTMTLAQRTSKLVEKYEKKKWYNF